VKEAIEKLVEAKGGTFYYQVPMVSAWLREDIMAECCEQVAPDEWPCYVAGSVLGGELEVAVEHVDDLKHASMTQSSFASTSSGKTSRKKNKRAGDEEVAPAVVIKANGFSLRITQRGGPPIDPSRLHEQTEDVVEKEFERWSKKPLTTRPGTWRTLHVLSFQGATEGGGLPQMDNRRIQRDVSETFGGSGTDVVLAATATAEISLEPFELSYGDAHVSSLKRMFEDEVADVLSIAPEQVMCGDFIPRGSGPALKHIRQNSVVLRFSLLHHEMVDVRGRVSTSESHLPKKHLPDKLNTLRGAQIEDLRGISEALPATSLLAKSKGGKQNMSMKNSSSLPDLSQSLSKTMGSMAESNSMRGLAITLSGDDSASANSDLQPDLLLRKLMASLTDRRHPMRRHPDVFPMLTRVLRGGILASETLVSSRDVIRPGAICESLQEFMRMQQPRKKAFQVDSATLAILQMKRSDILVSEEGEEGQRKERIVEFRAYSPKDLLDRMDSSLAIPTDLAACLQVLMESTLSDKDANGNSEMCCKFKFHRILERLNLVIARFKADRLTMLSCVSIVSNLTSHDIGCVDRILDEHIATSLIVVLGNFPKDHDMQAKGCMLLRRIFQRARENSTHGPRVILLGKGLDEVWTFRGVDRVLAAMAAFEDDEALQYDACMMLVSLAEMLYNNGKAIETFHRLNICMTKHDHRSDILKCGVLIIARLGPSFLAHEHRGVRTIVDAMERHRSDVELQRAGARAFFSLAKTEEALNVSRKGGSIGAMLIAMFTHTSDPQVLQESTRALEKHCPISLSKVFHVCGDLATTLPPVFWRADPLDFSGKSFFDIGSMQSQWNSKIIDDFKSEVLMHRKGQEPGQVVEVSGSSSLDTIEGYRKLGLRDELDALDRLWALPGPPSSAAREAGDISKQLKADIAAIEKAGADGKRLLVPGPKEHQLKQLCEGLKNGTKVGRNGAPNWSAHDAELMVLLLGFYAWHSEGYAKKLVEFGAAETLVAWLKCDHLKTNDVTKSAEFVPLQRACIGAMACLCRHGEDCVEALLEQEAAPLVYSFVNFLDISVKRNAARCFARMIPYATRKANANKIPPTQYISFSSSEPRTTEENRTRGVLSEDEKEAKKKSKSVWEFIIRELKEKDDTLRTCAAACVLEAAHNEWLSESAEEPAPMDELASALMGLLKTITPFVDTAPTSLQSTGALPILLTLAHVVGDKDGQTNSVAEAFMRREELTRLLMRWLPAGSSERATSVDKAAAAAAARTLEALSQREAPLGADDMEALLRHGSADAASGSLQGACVGALTFAVLREQNVEHLGQLFATRISVGGGGGSRLAIQLMLKCIVERIVQLLGSDVYRDCGPQDRLVRSLESAEELLPKEYGQIVTLVKEAKQKADSERAINVEPAELPRASSAASNTR